jgi:hydrogenase expression/formation protein HypC
MCLGVPGRVTAIDGEVATVDFGGVSREVRLELVDEPVTVGDHVLVHVGFALRRIAEEDLEATFAFFASLAAEEREGLPPSEGG